jgi:DHA3 family macrolide efflux protein-like MFS transporter
MVNSKTGMLTVLKNRDFLALWLSQLVSKIGDNFAVIAALTLINEVAQASGIAVVVIGVAVTIPQLFALASGVFLDRFSRKAVMIASDVLRAAVILLALVVETAGQLYILYLVAFVVMGLGAVYIPARNASIPNMVPEEHLLTANALIQATELVSLIVGASLAAVVIGLTSIQTAFIIDSITFGLSGLFLVAARIPQGRPAPAATQPGSEFRKFWAGFSEGVRYIGSNKSLLQLMAITTMATLGLSATTLLAGAYFEELLNISAEYMGFLLAAEGVGMAVGALLISSYATWARSRQTVSVTMIILGAGILVFALVKVYWLVLIGALVVGLCIVSARTTLAAMTQALVPDSQRGRVESAMVTVIGIGTMGALIMAGVLGDVVGPTSIFALTGIVVFVAGIASIFTLRGAEEELVNGNGSQLSSPPLE